MKHFLSGALLCLLSFCAMAQNKDCKFTKIKNAKGQTINCVIVTGQVSKLTLFKAEGKLGVTVALREFFAGTAETVGMLPLRIDSVKFVFADNTTASIKVMGMGNVKNNANAIKPMFDNVNFAFLIDNPAIEKTFGKTAIAAFTVVADKDAQFGDTFNEKQQAQILQAVSCLESQTN
jgi:hypothetical protein